MPLTQSKFYSYDFDNKKSYLLRMCKHLETSHVLFYKLGLTLEANPLVDEKFLDTLYDDITSLGNLTSRIN